MMTTKGKQNIRDMINGDVVAHPTHIAIGDGITPPSPGDLILGSEKFRKAITGRTKVPDARLRLSMTVLTTEAIGENLSEVGLFNDPMAGDMFNRQIHSPIMKTATIELRYIIELEVE